MRRSLHLLIFFLSYLPVFGLNDTLNQGVNQNTPSPTIYESDTTFNRKDTSLPILKDTITNDTSFLKKAADQKSPFIDTLAPLKGHSFAINGDVSIGSIEVFSLWQKSLQDSLRDFGLTPEFGFRRPDSAMLARGDSSADTSKLSYTIKENPSVYSIVFPIGFSYKFLDSLWYFEIKSNFAYISKQFKASVQPVNDSLYRRVDLLRKLALYSFAIEAWYGWRIPPEYFTIENIEYPSLKIGLGLSPYVTLKEQFKVTGNKLDDRFTAIRDSILLRKNEILSRGMMLSWHAAISGLRKISYKRGLEVSLGYSGYWNGLFRNNESFLNESDIHDNVRKDKRLSFVSNRIVVGFSLLGNIKE